MSAKTALRPKAKPVPALDIAPLPIEPVKKTRMKRGHADARVPDILNAAAAEFVEKGFAAARMEDIAARVGVSKPIIYRHFATKDALFKALISWGEKGYFVQAQQSIANYEGPLRQLLVVIVHILKTAIPTPRSMHNLAIMAKTPPHLVAGTTFDVIDPVREDLAKVFARAIRRGEMKKCDVEIAAKHFFAPGMQCIFRCYMLGLAQWKDWDMANYLDASLETFCETYQIH